MVAQLSSAAVPHQPGQRNPSPQILAQVNALVHASGVTGHSGPYPLAGAVVRARGLTAGVEVEGRSRAPASLDQPTVTAGGWVRGGGVVLERTFAAALGVGVGDRITLNGRAFRVAGTAVTAAMPPYPNLCYSPGGGCDAPFPGTQASLRPGALGLAWATQPDVRVLASSDVGPPAYVLNLKLKDPGPCAGLRQRPRPGPAGARRIAPEFLGGHQGRRRPARAGRAAGPVARGLAGLPAGRGQRGRAGRRPDGGAHPAGGAAQGGRRHPGTGRGRAAGREPDPGPGGGGRRAGHRVPGRPADHQPRGGAGGQPRRAVAHAARRRAGGGRGPRGGPGRDVRAGGPGRAHQHGQRAGRRGPPAAAPGPADRAVRPAAGAAAAGAAADRPPAAPRRCSPRPASRSR